MHDPVEDAMCFLVEVHQECIRGITRKTGAATSQFFYAIDVKYLDELNVLECVNTVS